MYQNVENVCEFYHLRFRVVSCEHHDIHMRSQHAPFSTLVDTSKQAQGSSLHSFHRVLANL